MPQTYEAMSQWLLHFGRLLKKSDQFRWILHVDVGDDGCANERKRKLLFHDRSDSRDCRQQTVNQMAPTCNYRQISKWRRSVHCERKRRRGLLLYCTSAVGGDTCTCTNVMHDQPLACRKAHYTTTCETGHTWDAHAHAWMTSSYIQLT